jgi:hypothetical protein
VWRVFSVICFKGYIFLGQQLMLNKFPHQCKLLHWWRSKALTRRRKDVRKLPR